MDSNETNLPPHIQELCDREDVAEFTDAEVGQLADFWFEDQLRKCPDNPALTGKQLRDISKLFSEQAIAGKHKLNKDTFHVFTDNVGNPWQCIVATDPEADGKHVGTFAICETERESKQPPARYVSTLYMYPTEHWQKAVPIAIAEAVVEMLSTMRDTAKTSDVGQEK